MRSSCWRTLGYASSVSEADDQLSKVLEEDKFSILTTTCGVSFSS